jgi:hypothetical protein
MILIKEERDYIPYDPSPLQPITRGTEKGFQVVDVPPAVYSILTEFYDRSKLQEENYPGKENYSAQKSYLQDINQYPDKVAFIKEAMLEIHQEWCGRNLKPAVVYGVRSYSDNTIFNAHFDRQDTHHIASSITLGKDAPWNLNIQDHDKQWWGVDVEPGQMIMFESGCCMHGRLDKYQGTYFDNLYTHFTYEEPFTEYQG